MTFDAQKTTAASLAGSITIVIVWAAKHYGHTAIPGEVAAAFATFLTGVLSHKLKLSNPT